MARPKRYRRMGHPPQIKGLKPYGNRSSHDKVKLLFEEYEAIKLADYDGYSQVDAAKQMDVSRPTFTRIYDRALKKVAEALVESKEIVLQSGSVVYEDDWFKCSSCDFTFKSLKVGGKIKKCPVCSSADIENISHDDFNETVAQGSDLCVCVHCGREEQHSMGIPCNKIRCSTCGRNMKRKL
ncbi:MAG: DUF134 domain-containing protein [Bacteroidota bacterium]|nr:DUF134 domain-containing protein [Bacteroidota bacterium]